MKTTTPIPHLFPRNVLSAPDQTFALCAWEETLDPTDEHLSFESFSRRELVYSTSLAAPRRRRWLAGRCAAKRALTVRLHEDGLSFDLQHIHILPNQKGAPTVSDIEGHTYFVSIAHKEFWSVAIASRNPSPGIDLERLIERPAPIEKRGLTEDERRWLDTQSPRNEWLTRLWVAKEVVGKSRGMGLAGSPRSLVWEDQKDHLLQVSGQWVETHRVDDWIVGWTLRTDGKIDVGKAVG